MDGKTHKKGKEVDDTFSKEKFKRYCKVKIQESKKLNMTKEICGHVPLFSVERFPLVTVDRELVNVLSGFSKRYVYIFKKKAINPSPLGVILFYLIRITFIFHCTNTVRYLSQRYTKLHAYATFWVLLKHPFPSSSNNSSTTYTCTPIYAPQIHPYIHHIRTHIHTKGKANNVKHIQKKIKLNYQFVNQNNNTRMSWKNEE